MNYFDFNQESSYGVPCIPITEYRFLIFMEACFVGGIAEYYIELYYRRFGHNIIEFASRSWFFPSENPDAVILQIST